MSLNGRQKKIVPKRYKVFEVKKSRRGRDFSPCLLQNCQYHFRFQDVLLLSGQRHWPASIRFHSKRGSRRHIQSALPFEKV